MAPHQLKLASVSEAEAVFECELCGQPCGFVKPEFGEPAAELINGQWQPPQDPERWMGECPGAES